MLIKCRKAKISTMSRTASPSSANCRRRARCLRRTSASGRRRLTVFCVLTGCICRVLRCAWAVFRRSLPLLCRFCCFLAMLSLSCDKVVALTGDRAEPSLSPLALLAILPQHCVLSNISGDHHVIFSNSDLLRSSPSCCAQSRSTRFFSLTGPNKSRQQTAFPHCRTSACARA